MEFMAVLEVDLRFLSAEAVIPPSDAAEQEEGDAKQKFSGVGGSSVECLPDDHAEGLLSESTSGENECTSNGNEEDVVMLSDSSVKDEDMDSDCSDDIDCNDTDASFSDQIDGQEQTAEEQSKVQEQTAAEHSDAQKKTADEHSHASKQTAEEQHSDAQKKSMDEHYGLHSFGFKEETIARVTRNDQPRENDFEEDRIFDVDHTPVTPPFSSVFLIKKMYLG